MNATCLDKTPLRADCRLLSRGPYDLVVRWSRNAGDIEKLNVTETPRRRECLERLPTVEQ